MTVVRLRCLWLEIYKTINRLNPALMRNLKLQINSTEITPQPSVEWLGVTIANLGTAFLTNVPYVRSCKTILILW